MRRQKLLYIVCVHLVREMDIYCEVSMRSSLHTSIRERPCAFVPLAHAALNIKSMERAFSAEQVIR